MKKYLGNLILLLLTLVCFTSCLNNHSDIETHYKLNNKELTDVDKAAVEYANNEFLKKGGNLNEFSINVESDINGRRIYVYYTKKDDADLLSRIEIIVDKNKIKLE
jgi:hypothetical protein